MTNVRTAESSASLTARNGNFAAVGARELYKVFRRNYHSPAPGAGRHFHIKMLTQFLPLYSRRNVPCINPLIFMRYSRVSLIQNVPRTGTSCTYSSIFYADFSRLERLFGQCGLYFVINVTSKLRNYIR